MKNRYREIYNNLYTIEERKELVAEAIKQVRIAKGFTQKEVSEIIDVGFTTYNTYETGRSAPPLEVIVRLAHLFNVDPAILLQFDNFAKDKMKQAKKLETYEKEIADLKERLKNATPEEQEKINQFISGIEQMLNALK